MNNMIILLIIQSKNGILKKIVVCSTALLTKEISKDIN